MQRSEMVQADRGNHMCWLASLASGLKVTRGQVRVMGSGGQIGRHHRLWG